MRVAATAAASFAPLRCAVTVSPPSAAAVATTVAATAASALKQTAGVAAEKSASAIAAAAATMVADRPAVEGVIPLALAQPGSHRLPRHYPLPAEILKWSAVPPRAPRSAVTTKSAPVAAENAAFRAQLTVSLDDIASFCTDIEMDIMDTLRENAGKASAASNSSATGKDITIGAETGMVTHTGRPAPVLTKRDTIVVASAEFRNVEKNRKACLRAVQGMLFRASYVPMPTIAYVKPAAGNNDE